MFSRWTVSVLAVLVVLAAVGAWRVADIHSEPKPSAEAEPAHPSIVMFGDSHTAIVNWRQLLDCPTIGNFGVSGNTSAQMLARLPSVIAAQPKIVFVLIGTNDVGTGVPAEQTLAHVEEVRSRLAASGIRTVVVNPPVLGDGRPMPPIKTDLVVNFDKSDLTWDGVHMQMSGYAKWRDVIAPVVKQYCQIN